MLVCHSWLALLSTFTFLFLAGAFLPTLLSFQAIWLSLFCGTLKEMFSRMSKLLFHVHCMEKSGLDTLLENYFFVSLNQESKAGNKQYQYYVANNDKLWTFCIMLVNLTAANSVSSEKHWNSKPPKNKSLV